MNVERTNTSDVAILDRLLRPARDSWPVAAARAILEIDFAEEDRLRMHELLSKVRDETLTNDEAAEIDNYERVGHLLDLMHSKARLALKRSQSKTPRNG